jgi:hypothetical protein
VVHEIVVPVLVTLELVTPLIVGGVVSDTADVVNV